MSSSVACTNRHFSVIRMHQALSVLAFYKFERIISLNCIIVNSKVSVSRINVFRSRTINYSLLRMILPLMVLGSSSRNSTILGYL